MRIIWIYGTHEHLIEAFEEVCLADTRGVVLRKGLELKKERLPGIMLPGRKRIVMPIGCEWITGVTCLIISGKDVEIRDLRMCFLGRVNVENATAAITVALYAGVTAGRDSGGIAFV